MNEPAPYTLASAPAVASDPRLLTLHLDICRMRAELELLEGRIARIKASEVEAVSDARPFVERAQELVDRTVTSLSEEGRAEMDAIDRQSRLEAEGRLAEANRRALDMLALAREELADALSERVEAAEALAAPAADAVILPDDGLIVLPGDDLVVLPEQGEVVAPGDGLMVLPGEDLLLALTEPTEDAEAAEPEASVAGPSLAEPEPVVAGEGVGPIAWPHLLPLRPEPEVEPSLAREPEGSLEPSAFAADAPVAEPSLVEPAAFVADAPVAEPWFPAPAPVADEAVPAEEPSLAADAPWFAAPAPVADEAVPGEQSSLAADAPVAEPLPVAGDALVDEPAPVEPASGESVSGGDREPQTEPATSTGQAVPSSSTGLPLLGTSWASAATPASSTGGASDADRADAAFDVWLAMAPREEAGEESDTAEAGERRRPTWLRVVEALAALILVAALVAVGLIVVG